MARPKKTPTLAKTDDAIAAEPAKLLTWNAVGNRGNYTTTLDDGRKFRINITGSDAEGHVMIRTNIGNRLWTYPNMQLAMDSAENGEVAHYFTALQ